MKNVTVIDNRLNGGNMHIVYRVIILILYVQGLLVANSSELIDITKINPAIHIDCVYATTRNFTNKQIYAKPVCYLLNSVAQALNNVQKELEKEGLGLLVWDAYRPLPAQQRLWDACPNEPKELYVAPPSQGGRHTRGTAVDVTIIRLADGMPLDMGTGHDDFSQKAHYVCSDISETVQQNRKKLRDIMMAHGFDPYEFEWWHFDFHGWREYPVLSVDFELLT
jgi:D-alanyl-D-alanine dipeptidase